MNPRIITKAHRAFTATENNHQPSVSSLMLQFETRQRHNTKGVNHTLLMQLAAFAGDGLMLHDITEDFCVRFTDFLLRKVKPNSARTYLHKLHALLEYASGLHLIPLNPMPAIKVLLPRVSTPRRDFLTHDEVLSLTKAECPHAETKRAFLFSCQTGLRLSDIETLTWSDVVDLGGIPTIVKMQVKTGQEVRIPLNEIALRLIGKRHREGLVFRMMSRSVISTDLRQWAANAGITAKHLTFHVSRHTFATLSISAGVDIYVVSKLCGHTAIRTTEIYAHMVDTTLQRGVNMLGGAFTASDDVHSKTRKSPILSTIKNILKGFVRKINAKIDGLGLTYNSMHYEKLTNG